MWLFFFHDSEHRKISKSLEKLMKYLPKEYKFHKIDNQTVQVIDKDGSEHGMIVWVEEIK